MTENRFTQSILIPDFGIPPKQEPYQLTKNDWHDGVLVRSPNWLGDVVMTFPALLQLRQIVPPYCGLFVQCPSAFVPLFRALNIIDYVVPIADSHAFLKRRERKTVYSLNPGIGILFNNSFRDALSLKIARVPKLFGASARFRSWLLEKSFEFEPRRDFVLNAPHQAQKYLSMVYALGAPEWQGNMPEMTPQAEPEILSRSVLALQDHDNILVIAPGAAYGDAKRWDAARFREVASYWIDKGGIAVAVGAKNERSAATETLSGLPPHSAFNLAGETTLTELMYLLKRAKMVAANDSGVMHLATALGTKGVAVFGSTDYIATGPLSKQWRIVYANPDCGPCFKRICPNGSRKCFEQIEAKTVISAIEQLQ